MPGRRKPDATSGAGASSGTRACDAAVEGVIRLTLKLDHLFRLTDNTGIYQHARGTRPNQEFGYCIDDNARALIVAIRAHNLTGDNSLIDYIRHYLAFVERCQRSDGRFRNFMSSNGQWLEEVGSEDSNGRSVWALGFAAVHSRQAEVRLRALRSLDAALPRLSELSFLKAGAFALLGLRSWMKAEPSEPLAALSHRFGQALLAAYRANSGGQWRWFENTLTYSSGRLCEALIGGEGESEGLEALTWLGEILEVNEVISLIGNDGWHSRGGRRADFDQQAVDAAALSGACVQAFDRTNSERFRRWAMMAYGWFRGANLTGQCMVDDDSGGCYDGLGPEGVNQNQGAESLLSWLMVQEDLMERGWLTQ